MSKKQSRKAASVPRGRDRRIRIRGQLKAQPDLNRIARIVVEIAIAQAEKEAQEQAASEADARKESS